MILKFAIRNIIKRPFLNIIKSFGLGLALGSILLIVLFLKNELTYDSFHKKSGRIYRFTITDKSSFAGSHFARVYNPEYIPTMADYFPEIENYVRLAPVSGGVIRHNEQYIKVTEAFECDSTFFELFDAEIIGGNPDRILNNPGSMIISESFAKKAFGKVNPIGQIVTLPKGQFYGRDMDFTINGIMKDYPQNSHFHPEFITTPVDKTILEGWAWTYLLLSENSNPDNIQSGFKDFFSSHIKKKTEEVKTDAHLQVISDIHLHSNKLREIEANSSMSVIYTLSLAALILLLIAIANYANLNLGMKDYSVKYLFVSKVSGSSNWMTMKYFLSEGVLIVLTSIIISGFIAALANILIQKYFALDLFTGNSQLIFGVIIIFGLISILAGMLPLLNQRKINMRSASDYKYKGNPGKKGLSKSIIVLQYSVAICLIVAVFVIRRQTSYALDSSMGAETADLICFEDVHTNVQNKFEVFKEELLRYNSIEYVSAMFEPPGGEANDKFQFKMEGYVINEINKSDNYIGVFPCDYSFAGIFKLDFLSGNNFSEKNEDNEGSGEYIINESAMRKLYYTDPLEIVGKDFELITNIGDIKIPSGKIIGVVRNFHLSGIKKEIEPLVLFKRKDLWLINFVVSYQPGMQKKALADIKSVWIKMFPEFPFEYEYISSMYVNVYKTELLQAKLLSIFTIISLFICSIGLLGMALLTTQRRTKEIGIRKISGAGISEIMIMLNWDLIKWIIIAFVIAIPPAILFMNKWLESFAYKTALSWWIFALAGLTALSVAVVTISVQSWKASSRNPVEALRYE